MGAQDDAVEHEGGWRARPRLALIVRFAVFACPFLAAIVAGSVVANAMAAPETLGDLVLAWVSVLIVATIVAAVVTRWARRVLPLAALLRMTLAFPDKAPSRFAIALRAGSVKTLRERAAELERRSTDAGRAAETVLMLVAALADHDRKTRGHSERVRAYAEMIAVELHIKGRALDRLRWAALLHDLGKMSIPAEILNGDRPLTDDEWAMIRRHPSEGARLAAPLAGWLGAWVETIHHHHERWDGSGYPDGVAGERIGIGARIVAVADAFEVMTAGRTYQRSISVEDAREVLTKGAGTQFDPTVVRAFLNCSLGRVAAVAGPLAWLGQVPALARLATAVGTPAQVVLAASVAVVGAAAAGSLPGMLVSPPASRLAAAPPLPMRVLEPAKGALPAYEPAVESSSAPAPPAVRAAPVAAPVARTVPVVAVTPTQPPREPAPASAPAPPPLASPPQSSPSPPPPGREPTVDGSVDSTEPPPAPQPAPSPLVDITVTLSEPVPASVTVTAVPGAATEVSAGPIAQSSPASSLLPRTGV